MSRPLLFTNHMRVLLQIARDGDLRMREIADAVGITERATHRIICELVEGGYLVRTRMGSRNHYELSAEALGGDGDGPGVDDLVRCLTEPTAPAAGTALTATGDDALFRTVFSAAPAGIVVADSAGRVLAVNPMLCVMLERTEDELLGRSFRDITHPEDRAADQVGMQLLVSGERTTFEREKRYLRPDGTWVWASVHVATTQDPTTGERLFVAHAQDIGRHRRQGECLSESEQRFRRTFEDAPIGMALVAVDGRYLKVNRVLCDITGQAETSLLMHAFQEITHPADVEADARCAEELLAGRATSTRLSKRYVHADGHIVPVEVSVSLVRDSAERPMYFVTQVQDLSGAVPTG